MKKRPISEIIINDFANSNYEASRKIDTEEAKKLPEATSYFFDELQDIEVDGFPFASDFVDKKGKSYTMLEYEKLTEKEKRGLRLEYHYLKKMHELYIGTTGSGKTTGCVEPQLRAIVTQKNKPNIFITDPKGEIYNHNAEYMKKMGYKVFVLNFKNIRKTNRWNPLKEIYDSYMSIKKYTMDNVKKVGSRYVFEGEEYEDEFSISNYLEQIITMIRSETDSKVKQFVELILPVQSKQDATWEQGAQNLAEGIIMCMLNAAWNTEKTGFTEDMFTIKTFFDFYDEFKKEYDTDDSVSYNELIDNPLVFHDGKACSKLATALTAPSRTKRSYLSVFDSSTRNWRQGHIFALTTGNTINFENSKSPFAIFVITRDYEKSDFVIAGLFIDYSYRTLLKEAEEKMANNVPLPTMHYLLDEFGNIPKIPNFDNKIATSRSRNIWMHLFLQSYEQINNVYDNNREAEVIISNCNSRIFLGSQSLDTIRKFSDDCGRHFVNTTNVFEHGGIIETNVLRISDLDLIEVGAMYMKRIYTPVIYTHFVRSYFLGNEGFYDDFNYDGLIKVPSINDIIYTDSEFTFDFQRWKSICDNDDDEDEDDDEIRRKFKW